MPSMIPNRPRTKAEQVLGWSVLLLLLLGCVVVLRPFISALIWAIVLCVSTWPLYRRLTAWLGQRRTLAAVLMALGMVLILLVPFVVIGPTLAENVKAFSTEARGWLEKGPPAPPAWLAKIPLVGQSATEQWQILAADTAKLKSYAREMVEPVSSALLKLGLLVGSGLMEIGGSILIACFLFRDGASLADRLTSAVDRIGGEHGRQLLAVAAGTMRGVVYGLLGTALVQAILAGIGFAIAGVPNTAMLTLVTFFVSMVPMVGVALVWLPVAIWLFAQGETGWGIFMVIWGIGVNNIDNFIKPILIGKGSDLPFLLILFGILGGGAAFGFIGVFLGPTLLAVGYRVVQEWGRAVPPEPEPGVAGLEIESRTAIPAETLN
ncbi:MAG: AI-2E family transporter [Verrucomicrobia bacterium]|nr:MAG: AI-2E family transporter [Verrucomicrobiota bacterium]